MGESRIVPARIAKQAFAQDDRTIGAVLIKAGRLRVRDAKRILRLQRQKKVLFGEAGIELGVLTRDDIDFALSRQFDFPYLRRGESAVSDEVVTAYATSTPQAEALRTLRSQLMARWYDTAPASKAVAIVSAERKDGRSFIAANLAVVFSQLGQRTLLIDADMRNPCQHLLFGVDNRVGLSAVLSGRAEAECVQRIPSLANLSVLPAGALPPNPQELLARPLFSQLLEHMSALVDVILLDSPAAGETSDAQTIALRAGAALIVARKNAARSWQVQAVSDSVTRVKVTIVGAVLNSY